MNILDTSRPETSPGEIVTIYRDAMSPALAGEIASTAFSLLRGGGCNVHRRTNRGFTAFPIQPIESSIPILNRMAAQLLTAPLPRSTMRINLQEGGGRQGWHQDYILEPLVVYPVGKGYLDLAPFATDLREARASQEEDQVVSIPVSAGDVAVVHRGGEIFHRGRNGSEDEPRVTIVLH